MKLSINKAHFPVTVLGPGRRIGIWFQGCSIGCKGCVSQDTWPRDPGRDMSLAHLIAWCKQTSGGNVDGITLSGGEPFDQPQGLKGLLQALHLWRRQAGLDFDILCYSGYPYARLQQRHAPLLALLDALIPEPYVDTLPLSHRWRGSANQTLVALSDRGRTRYDAFIEAPADPADKRLQVMNDGQRVWVVGIPDRGDMAALENQCETRGVQLAEVSWR